MDSILIGRLIDVTQPCTASVTAGSGGRSGGNRRDVLRLVYVIHFAKR